MIRPFLLLLAFIATRIVSAQVVPQSGVPDLAGTSWQLVKFEGGDGTVLMPDSIAKYTIAFGSDGRVSARIDCNRGNGTWKSEGSNHLEFGPLALTRMMCPPGSLHDRIAKHWQFVRSYVIEDSHLFLSLMADGGIYEFEQMSGGEIKAAPVQRMATDRARSALPPSVAAWIYPVLAIAGALVVIVALLALRRSRST